MRRDQTGGEQPRFGRGEMLGKRLSLGRLSLGFAHGLVVPDLSSYLLFVLSPASVDSPLCLFVRLSYLKLANRATSLPLVVLWIWGAYFTDWQVACLESRIRRFAPHPAAVVGGV